MEINDNISSEAKSQPQANPPRAKPPTRLQKRAPAALQLDAINDLNTSYPLSNATLDNHCAIPLLSPLILSPQPLSEAAEEQLHEGGNNDLSGGTEIMAGGGGWVHPAVGTYPEAASMFDFFQSQCTFVHRVQ